MAMINESKDILKTIVLGNEIADVYQQVNYGILFQESGE